MPNIQLAKNLRHLRKKYGLNQDDLEDILNVSRQAYSNYETCKRTPDLDTLIRIARFYDVSLDDLILTNLRTDSGSDSVNGVREPVSSYTYAKCEETGNSVYVTEQELKFIADFRSLSEETRQILTGFLNNAVQR